MPDVYGHTPPNDECDCGHDFEDELINWHFRDCPKWHIQQATLDEKWQQAIVSGNAYMTDEDGVWCRVQPDGALVSEEPFEDQDG